MAAAKISPNYTFLAGNHFNFGVNNRKIPNNFNFKYIYNNINYKYNVFV